MLSRVGQTARFAVAKEGVYSPMGGMGELVASDSSTVKQKDICFSKFEFILIW